MEEEEKKEKKVKEEKEEKGNKKVLIIILILVLLLIIAFLCWWFLRKFEVTINYNNGLDNTTEDIRYLTNFDKEDLEDKVKKEGYVFGGYHEVYYLDGKEIETIKKDPKTQKTICKEGYYLSTDKTRCIEEKEFDFENTKIKKDTNIEVVWKKKAETTTKTEEPAKTPTQTTTKKDTGTVKLSVSKSCIVGSGSKVKVTAKISGNTDNKTLTWNLPKCYKATKVSNTVYTLTRSGCTESAATETISASLKNGSKSTVKFKYEPTLVVDVYERGSKINETSGGYWGNSITIKTNTASTFKELNTSYKSIKSTTKTSAELYRDVSDTITVKTSCGQTKSIKIIAVIN